MNTVICYGQFHGADIEPGTFHGGFTLPPEVLDPPADEPNEESDDDIERTDTAAR